MCSWGSRNPSLKPGGCTSLYGLCRDTLVFTHLSLTGNKMQTAVINIRKYKRILYFLMFVTVVCFLFLLYGDVPLNRVWFVFFLRLRSSTEWGRANKRSETARQLERRRLVLSVLNRVYNFVRVCPNYKQGTSCTMDLICMMNLFWTSSIRKQCL